MGKQDFERYITKHLDEKVLGCRYGVGKKKINDKGKILMECTSQFECPMQKLYSKNDVNVKGCIYIPINSSAREKKKKKNGKKKF